jgi:hypothetical protein
MTVGWRKSSYSGSEAQCVEVGGHAGSGLDVLVRDTQDRAGAVLAVTPNVWRKFTNELK